MGLVPENESHARMDMSSRKQVVFAMPSRHDVAEKLRADMSDARAG